MRGNSTYNLPFLFPGVNYCMYPLTLYQIVLDHGKLCCLLFPEDGDDAFSVCLLLIGVSALESLCEQISIVYLSSNFFGASFGQTSFPPDAHQNSPSILLSSLQV